MQKTFTRNELIRTALNHIRIDIKIYRKTKDIIYVQEANNIAWALNTLELISAKKTCWLIKIISEMAFDTRKKIRT